MAGYYETDTRGFSLFRTRDDPAWREPQLAALGAVVAQWSLAGSETPLVSVPTGVGKTAIALAAPFLARARRTLVVVPTQELRRQTVQRFSTQDVLLRIGALRSQRFKAPIVHEAKGRIDDWSQHDAADVIVGIPASINPAHAGDNPPRADMFDLVIVDEAHHAPAATWLAILEHFAGRKLLLTATPHRRDRTANSRSARLLLPPASGPRAWALPASRPDHPRRPGRCPEAGHRCSDRRSGAGPSRRAGTRNEPAARPCEHEGQGERTCEVPMPTAGLTSRSCTVA